MGRRQTIDRNAVLDAAEAVIREKGINSLTIEAVARAGGISKGGVQYCFGSRDAMIRAMIDRWEAEFDGEVAAMPENDGTVAGQVRAHVAATAQSGLASADRAAVMLAALSMSAGQRAEARTWYTARLREIAASGVDAGALRLAFLATEGVFLLRSFGLVDMDDAEWDAIFRDIAATAAADDGAGAKT